MSIFKRYITLLTNIQNDHHLHQYIYEVFWENRQWLSGSFLAGFRSILSPTNVLDYFVWNYLESKACSQPHKSIAALKASLVKEWNEIPQEMIQKAIDDFSKRLRKCIDANGGHFE